MTTATFALPTTGQTSTSRRRPATWCRYWSWLALVFPLVLLWSLATPLMSAVDEPAHAFWAAAAVRGEFLGPLVKVSRGYESVIEVPASMAAYAHSAACLAKSPSSSAHCMIVPATTTRDEVPAASQFGRYPPLYYLAVGWPSLFLQGSLAIWGERMASALLAAALLAMAAWALASFHSEPGIMLGWALATTPTVLYFAGVVNDSALEMSAALAVWASLLAIVDHPQPPRRLIIACALAMVCLILARPLSPGFAALAIFGAAVVAGRDRFKVLSADPRIRAAGVVAVIALVAFLGWRLLAGSPPILGKLNAGGTPWGEAISEAFAQIRGNLVGLIGLFLLTWEPWVGVGTWLAALFLVGWPAARAVPARIFLFCFLGLLAVIFVPVAANLAEIHKLGIWWQPRYTVPFACGIPLILTGCSSKGVHRRRISRRAQLGALWGLMITQVSAFVITLHRYTSGLNGGWFPPRINWEPPGNAFLLTAAFILCCTALGGRIWRGMPEMRSVPEL